MTEPTTTINDWLKAQRTLLERERYLADVAERFARGAATEQELNEAHESAIAHRALAEAVFKKALARKG